MKYIDAEKLKAEIERLRKELPDSIEHLNEEERGFARWRQHVLTAIEEEMKKYCISSRSQRETDGDDGKFVKILVRKEFAEQIQKLGDQIKAGQSSFVGAMNRKEQLSEICSKCIHHGKDDDYCYNPHGGMQSLINENGVYECTGFCEKEQGRPEVELETEIEKELRLHYNDDQDVYWWNYLKNSFRHFYELGRRQVLQEIYDGKTKPVDKITAAWLDD